MSDLSTAQFISDREYLRERIRPQPGDSLYLHLSDLRLAMEHSATGERIRVLDFGCGGSPYRSLFPHAEYLRADLPEVTSTDYHISPDSQTNAPSESFDLVLSSQVLEHCPDPLLYLAEARRVLRPGGKLLLSTHGIFEDHACPYDFQRWTGFGLTHAISAAGFSLLSCRKLTTAGRALAFLLEYHGKSLQGSRRTARGLFFWVMQSAVFSNRRGFHGWCDKRFSQQRVVDAQLRGHSIYIGLLVEATKL
jgi:SAM-dependent methyltransferase